MQALPVVPFARRCAQALQELAGPKQPLASRFAQTGLAYHSTRSIQLFPSVSYFIKQRNSTFLLD